MYENKVWTLVDLPDGRQAIENKWIFKRKTDADGNVTVYKARVVAKRFSTKFKELNAMRFSHSYRCLKSVRIMLAIAAFYEIWQMDNKTAILNGFIKKGVVYDATRRFCQS